MNFSEVITLLQLQGGAQLVSVRFLDGDGETAPRPFQRKGREERSLDGYFDPGQTYTYKCLTVDNPQPGDMVVVEARDSFAVGKIVAILPPNIATSIGYENLKHVVARVDRSAMDRVLAAETKVRESLVMAEINERLASIARNLPGGNIDGLQGMLAIAPASMPIPPGTYNVRADAQGNLQVVDGAFAGATSVGTLPQ